MRTTALALPLIALQLVTSSAIAAPDVEDEIRALNLERLHALASGNLQRLERLFADDFVYVTASGKTETKDDFRRSIAGGYRLPFVEPQNLRVRVHGASAVVTYTTRRDMPTRQTPIESVSTCIYVHDARSGWQLLSQQTTRISH